MASQRPFSTQRICGTCLKVPWNNLQPEDVRGNPHHLSREALEASARECRLCKLILRAAISNYRDSRDTRNGKGYWKQSLDVDYVEDSGVRKVTYVKDLGSCMPATNPNFHGRAIIGPTGHIDANGEHVMQDPLPDLEALEIQPSTSPMKVWLYSNWWCDGKPASDDDTSHFRLMGIGVRYGSSQSIFDAINNVPDNIHLRGSAIGMCTNDGKCVIHTWELRV